MNNVLKGTEPNVLTFLVDNIEIKPSSRITNGLHEDGVMITINHYHLNDVLNQMLDDYGEDVLITRIKSLK